MRRYMKRLITSRGYSDKQNLNCQRKNLSVKRKLEKAVAEILLKIGVALIAAIAAGSLLTGCTDPEPDFDDSPLGNFDALAHIIDSRYCFFDDKDIDWNDVTARYRAEVTPQTSQLQLFDICSRMLDELRDGHVNLVSSFDTSYYRQWWSDYPQDFNLRTLQQYYLQFDYSTTSGMIYRILPATNIGYLYYPSFSSGISQLSLDYVLAQFSQTDALIIDIRDNGGGYLTNIDILVGRLIDREIPGGSICHKTGPGHDDFSDPYSFTYKPADATRISYLGKPVAVLTNRSCYSAANAFAAVMKSLPNVTLIGARTGGGGGLPFSSELPNGWSVRFSASPLYGPDGELTEFGVDPTPGYECHSPEAELAAGRDAILERAVTALLALTAPAR